MWLHASVSTPAAGVRRRMGQHRVASPPPPPWLTVVNDGPPTPAVAPPPALIHNVHRTPAPATPSGLPVVHNPALTCWRLAKGLLHPSTG